MILSTHIVEDVADLCPRMAVLAGGRILLEGAPLQLIQDRLMLEARRLLAYTASSVAEIAFQLGFEPAYFSRAFTRQEGLSPVAFRRRASWSGPDGYIK